MYKNTWRYIERKKLKIKRIPNLSLSISSLNSPSFFDVVMDSTSPWPSHDNERRIDDTVEPALPPFATSFPLDVATRSWPFTGIHLCPFHGGTGNRQQPFFLGPVDSSLCSACCMEKAHPWRGVLHVHFLSFQSPHVVSLHFLQLGYWTPAV